jgi:hypothetical protein
MRPGFSNGMWCGAMAVSTGASMREMIREPGNHTWMIVGSILCLIVAVYEWHQGRARERESPSDGGSDA